MIRRAFTLLELLIAIGIIAILMAILLPAMERARHRGYIAACASNLRQLGEALLIYANDNGGQLPRTKYAIDAPPVAGTGGSADEPFAADGPDANDVTAALWLLARVQKLPTHLFICPYNDVNEFAADRAMPPTRSNFTDYRRNLGYSYANPYLSSASTRAGARSTVGQPATFAWMADLNPGVSSRRRADVFKPKPDAGAEAMEAGNSENHEREGQNVLYADGHVDYHESALAGTEGDNIYTARDAVAPTIYASPAGPGDSVLLPAE